MLYEAMPKPDPQADLEVLARDVVARFDASKTMVPGIGHPFHKPIDPRTARLIALAKETGFHGRYVELIQAIAAEAKHGGEPADQRDRHAGCPVLRDGSSTTGRSAGGCWASWRARSGSSGISWRNGGIPWPSRFGCGPKPKRRIISATRRRRPARPPVPLPSVVKVVAEGAAGVVGAEQPSLLKLRHDAARELLPGAGEDGRGQDEAVAGLALGIVVKLVGHRLRRADDLPRGLARGEAPGRFAQGQAMGRYAWWWAVSPVLRNATRRILRVLPIEHSRHSSRPERSRLWAPAADVGPRSPA